MHWLVDENIVTRISPDPAVFFLRAVAQDLQSVHGNFIEYNHCDKENQLYIFLILPVSLHSFLSTFLHSQRSYGGKLLTGIPYCPFNSSQRPGQYK